MGLRRCGRAGGDSIFQSNRRASIPAPNETNSSTILDSRARRQRSRRHRLRGYVDADFLIARTPTDGCLLDQRAFHQTARRSDASQSRQPNNPDRRRRRSACDRRFRSDDSYVFPNARISSTTRRDPRDSRSIRAARRVDGSASPTWT